MVNHGESSTHSEFRNTPSIILPIILIMIVILSATALYVYWRRKQTERLHFRTVSNIRFRTCIEQHCDRCGMCHTHDSHCSYCWDRSHSVDFFQYTSPELNFSRLHKDLQDLTEYPLDNIKVEFWDDKAKTLVVDLDGAKNTLYEGKKFKLSFKFSKNYPFECPLVTFIGEDRPIHPYVFSNCYICLPIFRKWNPALSVKSICLSVMDMLASAQR